MLRNTTDSGPPAAALAQRFAEVRERTLALAAPLSAEDCQLQSMPDASPTKWHLAHTSWFFETFVLAPAGHAPRSADFAFLFNSYYNSVGPMHARPARGMISRPSLDEVLDYRSWVDERMGRVLDPDLDDDAAALVELGLNHEQQHQELLLTDIKHAFSLNPTLPAYGRAPEPTGPAAPLSFIGFPEGLTLIGADDRDFAFDNERPRHRVWLDAFELANRPVTNGEFRAFVEDGGYARPELWLSDGWMRVQADGWSRPLYWTDDLSEEFTLGGLAPLDPDAPVCHLSHYEADAYARWAGARLPTEFEWEAAAGTASGGHFADAGRLHPRAATGAGLLQVFGDVWEWTASAYHGYPGFKPTAGSVGEYNGKFMSGQMVLRGGSCLTPAGHTRASYRNFFPASARWQCAGVRLARDA